jgi:hypothetical protein
MAFIQAKAIKVYYTKGDRKPYDVNGKPLSYLGQESIGANIATQVRFYLGEDLSESITPIVVTKRADGDRHFDILSEGTDTEVTPNQKYYYVDLSNWYAEKVGKLTLALKVYSGTVTIEDDEITASTGRIVVSDIFHIDVAYAPDASDLVPPFDPDYYEELLEALANKVERQEVIQVVNTLPTVSSADNGKWFLVRQTNGGRLYRVLGGVAVEVETEMGQLKLTPTGNGEVTTNTGQVAWEQENGTVELGLYNDVVLHLGEDVMYYAKASGAIVKGDVVQFAGYQGDHAIIKKAVPVEINTQPKLIMGIAKQNIANNDFGYVLAFGKLQDVDTKGYENGDLIWFDSVNGTGQWTNVVPTAPNAKVLLAVIVKKESSGSANNGVILVRPTFESKLDDLQNVLIASPNFGDVLRLDGTGTKWVNSNALTTAETEIDTLQSDVIGLDNTKADLTYVDSQDTNLSNRITFIETNGGIDFIKVANFASLPTSGDVRNHRLFMTIDTKQLWEFDGTQYNESSPTDLSTIEVSADLPNDVAMNVIGDSTLTADILRVRDGNGDIVAVVQGDGDVVLENDLVVEGNLTVNGTTTTVNTTTVAIEDNIILINSNQTGTPSETLKGGIEIERGDSTNYQFVFDESDDRFKVGQVGSLQTVATRQDDVNMVASGVPFYNDTEKRFDTSSNLKVNASGQLVDTTIRNSATTIVPLIVNGVASTSANIQQWQVNGSTVALIYNNGNIGTNGAIRNINDIGRSNITLDNNGVIIGRNIADANHALRVDLANSSSTGNIANFQFAGANKLEITRDGFLNQNGTRFIHNAGTQNIFVGLESGTTTLTGTENTGIGRASLNQLSSGSYNVGVGRNALSQNNSGSFNIAVGVLAGFRNTSGTNNTFLGYNAGVNALQIANGTNTTAIGNDSYTDKSNQMVFGNASVSEFKFDRNTSAIVLMPQIQTSSSSPSIFERTGTDNSSLFSSFSIRRKTTADMADGFGNGLSFEIIDNAGVVNQIGVMGALRSGADNSGRFTFLTNNAGTLTEKMTIMPNGNVGIGTTSPSTVLELQRSGDIDFGFKNTADTSGNFWKLWQDNYDSVPNANFLFKLSYGSTDVITANPNGRIGIGTSSPIVPLHIRATTTNYGFTQTIKNEGSGSGRMSALSLATDNLDTARLAIVKHSNTDGSVGGRADIVNEANFPLMFGTNNTERMRILADGKVGIGTATPAGILSISTGTTSAFNIQNSPTNSLNFGNGSSVSGQPIIYSRNNSNVVGLYFLTATTDTNSIGDIVFNTRRDDGTANGASFNTLTSKAYVFQTGAIGTSIELMSIGRNGLVGINETSPTAQLQVKSGATDRPTLIVNTLASHTASVQNWQINGSNVAYMASNGALFLSTGVANLSSSANSFIATATTGTTISRNVADGNHALVVNLDNSTSTGSILSLRRAGVTQASIARDGIANFTGTPSNEQTDDYTLVLADKGKVLRVNSSSNRTITIPLNSSVAFPIDTEIALIRYGSGTVSISPTSGVTLNSISSNRKVKDQYGSCALKKIGTDEWVLVGSLEA